jgi:hydroxybutyrate-dimer hydrolase
LRTANLRGKPAIIVHGRNDALIPVNHNSRAYFAANKLVEGAASRLSYIEITNAQHFDTFLALPLGYDSHFVPMHGYHIQAMNMMYNHLRNPDRAPLPPSQVVRTEPRRVVDGVLQPLTNKNVPAIQTMPGAEDRITFTGNTMEIPE